MEVRRNLSREFPQLTISSNEIVEAAHRSLNQIVFGGKIALEQTPAGTRRDIADRGMMLTARCVVARPRSAADGRDRPAVIVAEIR